jgi:hypothetical protein
MKTTENRITIEELNAIRFPKKKPYDYELFIGAYLMDADKNKIIKLNQTTLRNYKKGLINLQSVPFTEDLLLSIYDFNKHFNGWDNGYGKSYWIDNDKVDAFINGKDFKINFINGKAIFEFEHRTVIIDTLARFQLLHYALTLTHFKITKKCQHQAKN